MLTANFPSSSASSSQWISQQCIWGNLLTCARRVWGCFAVFSTASLFVLWCGGFGRPYLVYLLLRIRVQEASLGGSLGARSCLPALEKTASIVLPLSCHLAACCRLLASTLRFQQLLTDDLCSLVPVNFFSLGYLVLTACTSSLTYKHVN